MGSGAESLAKPRQRHCRRAARRPLALRRELPLPPEPRQAAKPPNAFSAASLPRPGGGPRLRPASGRRGSAPIGRPVPAPPGAGCRGGGVLAGGPRCAALGDPSAPAMPCEQREGAAAPARYVVGVDVGSTVLKCHVYDQAAAVRGSSCKKVNQGRGAGGAAAEPCAARPRGEGCPAPGGIGGRRQPQPVGRSGGGGKRSLALLQPWYMDCAAVPSVGSGGDHF